MIKCENECVGCTDMGMPCMGDHCPNRNVPRLYCDRCRQEVEELRHYEGEQVCNDCILENYEIVEV